MAVTLSFQNSGAVPGGAGPVQMQGGSLTVGRGPANDLVLPDPDRVLSKSHCVIEDHNGNVMVVDLSTNGTFLNYAKIPLGRTPTPLNNGDVLSVGPYELIVQITDTVAEIDPAGLAPAGPGSAGLDAVGLAPAALDPLSPGNADQAPDPLSFLDDPGLDDPGAGGDFLDDLLGSSDQPTGPKQLNPVDPIDDLLPPLGEDEDPFFQKPDDGRAGQVAMPMHTPSAQDAFAPQAAQATQGGGIIPDDWDDLIAPTEPAPTDPAPSKPEPTPAVATPTPVPDPQADPQADPAPQSDPGPVAPADAPDFSTPMARRDPAPKAAPETAPAPAATSDAARAFLDALGAPDMQQDAAEMTKTMARLGRIMHTMVTGLREILMTRTSIKSEFRIEQTMISAGGNNPLKFSISPEQAIEAMVRPTIKGYLSPETATEQALDDIKAHEVAMVTGMEAALKGVLARLDPAELTGKIESSGALGGLFKGKKARYWEVYEQMYSEISDQAENDFHDLFSREFARAYQAQLETLKTK